MDTQKTAMAVDENLKKSGYASEVLGIYPRDVDRISDIRADLVFNLIEWAGKETEDGVTAVKILEKMGMPFTGSSAWGYLLTCDKVMMKRHMDKHKIVTPKWQVFETGDETVDKKLKYPLIVKPSRQHCGIGITQDSVVGDDTALAAKARELVDTYHEPILAEEYIAGRELHVTMLEKNGRPWVLPAAEVTFKEQKGYVPILSYDMKWNEKSWEYNMAGDMAIPELPAAFKRQLETTAVICYRKLGGRDYPRLDVRIRQGKLYVLEINNNPGIDFETDSGIGMSARAAGFKTFGALLSHIVENAYYRWRETYDAAAA